MATTTAPRPQAARSVLLAAPPVRGRAGDLGDEGRVDTAHEGDHPGDRRTCAECGTDLLFDEDDFCRDCACGVALLTDAEHADGECADCHAERLDLTRAEAEAHARGAA